MESLLAILLAGGAGERLYPLTRRTAKPAVPFGGCYRIIDFTLSNCINSNIRKMFVLTQYKSLDLNRHLRDAWTILSPETGEFIEVLPPMKRVHDDWYLGTADAVYQNIESIEAEATERTLIVSGDHIYKMNYHEMLDWHRFHHADATIATIRLAPEEAPSFGVVEIGDDFRVVGFQEKPAAFSAVRSVYDDTMISASMGIYLFETELLLKTLIEDASLTGSSHDFGKDILPRLLHQARVVAYDFNDLNRKKAHYWRDVGTLQAYYDANMDLVSVTPEFNLYDRDWPIRCAAMRQPPAKFVFAQEGRRMGVAIDSIVSPGSIVSGGRIMRCVVSPDVRVNSYCEVFDSILLPGCRIGRYSRIQRAIIDSGMDVPEASVIGFDREEDLANGYYVTDSGVVVVSALARQPVPEPVA